MVVHGECPEPVGFHPQEGRAAEAVADLTRAIELSEPSPTSLHYLAKALKVTKVPGIATCTLFLSDSVTFHTRLDFLERRPKDKTLR